MKQFAWYSPEIDIIILQIFEVDEIYFSWLLGDTAIVVSCNIANAPWLELCLWIPLGEL